MAKTRRQHPTNPHPNWRNRVVPDGRRPHPVECRFVDETLWLSQAHIAELFQVTVATVNEHLKDIFDEGEVQPVLTIRNSE